VSGRWEEIPVGARHGVPLPEFSTGRKSQDEGPGWRTQASGGGEPAGLGAVGGIIYIET